METNYMDEVIENVRVVTEACENPNNHFGDFSAYFLEASTEDKINTVKFMMNEYDFPTTMLWEIDAVVNFKREYWQ